MYVSHTDICADVSYGMYATRHGLNEEQLGHLWTNLGAFVSSTLRCGKGAVLPGLGTFYAAAPSQFKQSECGPAFYLQERTFRGISQEAPRSNRKGTTAQLNYNAVGQNIPLHRAAVQRLVRELLSKLASSILSNDVLQVELPHVGTFVRRKGGRFRFQFSTALPARLNGDTCAMEPPQPLQTQSGANNVPPSIAPSPCPPLNIHASAGPYHHDPSIAINSPRGSGIAALRALCIATDTSNTGHVTRLQMERWLNRDCRMIVNHLPGAALLDLLQKYSHGRHGTYIAYGPLIHTLEAQLAHMRAAEAVSQPRMPAPGLARPATPTAPSGSPRSSQLFQAPQDWPGATVSPAAEPARMASPKAGAAGVRRPSGDFGLRAQSVLSDMAAVSPGLADQEPFPYFMQADFMPRNRRECDEFNRFHFERLRAVRGERGLTPKVGSDPLTEYEVHYAQQVQRNRSASPPGERQRYVDMDAAGSHGPPQHSTQHSMRPSTAWPDPARQQRSSPNSPHGGRHSAAEVQWPYMNAGLNMPAPVHQPAGYQQGTHQQLSGQQGAEHAHRGVRSGSPHRQPNDIMFERATGQRPDSGMAHRAASPAPATAAFWPGTHAHDDAHALYQQQGQQHSQEARCGRALPQSSPGGLAAHDAHGSRDASLTFHPHQQAPGSPRAPGAKTSPTADARQPSPMPGAPCVAAGAAPPMQRLVRSVTPPEAAPAGHSMYNGAAMPFSAEGVQRPGMHPPGGIADENRRPGSRAKGLDELHARSSRDPSPVKELLRWEPRGGEGGGGSCASSRGARAAAPWSPAPPASTTAAACAAAAAGVGDADTASRRRSDAAASLRQSYSQQIEEREALRERYAAAESKWPYQPIHHPEARFPYFNGPRYVRPHFVSSPMQL